MRDRELKIRNNLHLIELYKKRKNFILDELSIYGMELTLQELFQHLMSEIDRFDNEVHNLIENND